MNLLLWFPHRRKLLEITNITSVWMSFLNCAVKKKKMDPMTELLQQVGSLFSCGGLVPVLSGCTGIIFRFYSRKYLKETRNVIQFCRYFSMSIKTCISFLVFFHFSEKDSKPHHFFIHFYIFLGIFSLIFLYNSLNTNSKIDILSLVSSTLYYCIFPQLHGGIGSVSFVFPSFFLSGQDK